MSFKYSHLADCGDRPVYGFDELFALARTGNARSHACTTIGMPRVAAFLLFLSLLVSACAPNGPVANADAESFGGSAEVRTLLASAQGELASALERIAQGNRAGFCDKAAKTDATIDGLLARLDSGDTALTNALWERLTQPELISAYRQRLAAATFVVANAPLQLDGMPVEAITNLDNPSAPIRFNPDLRDRSRFVHQTVFFHELGHQISDASGNRPNDSQILSLGAISLPASTVFDLTGACIARAIAYRAAVAQAPATRQIYRLTNGNRYYYGFVPTAVNTAYVSQGVVMRTYVTPSPGCDKPFYMCVKVLGGDDFYLGSGCYVGDATIALLGYFCATPTPGTEPQYIASTNTGGFYITPNVNEINSQLSQGWFSYGLVGFFPNR